MSKLRRHRRYGTKKRKRTTSRTTALARRKRRKSTYRPKYVLYNRLMGPSIVTKLVYCDTKALTPGSGADRHLWEVNGIYDPDHTGVGHQPMFHDQWAQLYTQFRVLDMKVTCQFLHAPTSAEENTEYGTYVGNGDTYPFATAREARHRRICFIEFNKNTTAKFSEPTDLNSIREHGSLNKLVKWRMMDDEKRKVTIRGTAPMKAMFSPDTYNIRWAVGSTPTSVGYVHVGVMSPDGGTANTVEMNIRIEYTVEFSNLIDTEGS